MSEAEHTPGGWEWHGGYDPDCLWAKDGTYVLMPRDDGTLYEQDLVIEVSHADARLIATAPELLAALKSVRDKIVAEYNWRCWEVNFKEAAAAIAKATTTGEDE